MGGYYNSQQQIKKKSSSSPFAIFNILKGKRPGSLSRKVDDDDSVKYYKVWPSDEDRGRFVAEPGIDIKATAYIAKFHAKTSEYGTRELDRQ